MALPESPITRQEMYLAKAAGQDVDTPEPITRVEMYLDSIAEKSGGGEVTITVDSDLSSTSENPVQNKAIKAALDGKVDFSSVYTKTQIDQKLVGVMNYRGTKPTRNDLPNTGNASGDVWHITADGSEWAWNGSAWEELGTIINADDTLSSTSVNAVQNKVVKAALDNKANASALSNKVDKVSGKGLSTNDYTTTEKNKLAGIEAGAQKNPDLSGYALSVNVHNIPSGGTAGQFLVKSSATNYDVAWVTVPSANGGSF